MEKLEALLFVAKATLNKNTTKHSIHAVHFKHPQHRFKSFINHITASIIHMALIREVALAIAHIIE